MIRRRLLSAFAAAGAIVLASSGIIAADAAATSKTGTSASKPSEAAEKALSLAVGETQGIMHGDVKTGLMPFVDELAKSKEPVLPKETFDAFGKLSKKATAIDLILLKDMLFIAVHGDLSPDDLPDIRTAIQLAGPRSQSQPSTVPAVEHRPGEYHFPDAPVTVVFGGESKLAPKGVTLIGPRELLEAPSLPPADKDKLSQIRQELSHVDTSAPAWGVVIKADPDAGSKGAITAQLYPDGKGTSVLTVSEDEVAINEADRNAKALLPSARISRTDSAITITSDKATTDLVKAFALARAKLNSRISATNLKNIGIGIQMYAMENMERLPADISDVIQYFAADAKSAERILVNPTSGRKVTVEKVGSDWKIKGEGDYVYIRYMQKLPELGNISRIMIAYERPENYKNEKTYVLYADGHAFEVPIKEFNDLLKAAEKLQAAGSQPAGK